MQYKWPPWTNSLYSGPISAVGHVLFPCRLMLSDATQSWHPFNRHEYQDGVVELTFLKGTRRQLARSPHSSSLSPKRRQGTLCIYSHAHDREVSFVSKHLFLPPAARCDIHNAIWPSAFCSMRTLALDNSDTEQRVAYLVEISWQRKGVSNSTSLSISLRKWALLVGSRASLISWIGWDSSLER